MFNPTATRGVALAALLASLAAGAQAQQIFTISHPLTDFSTWQLFGSATTRNDTPGNGFTYSDLILTSVGTGDQAGAGFAPQAIALDFNQYIYFSFNFFLPQNFDLRGDGLTFTLATTPGVGGGGSDLGYGGLGASVAVAVDTFHFDDEPASPSVQILLNGNITPVAATETGLGDSIRDPNFQWSATVEWSPSGLGDNTGTLTGTIQHFNLGSYSVQAPLDLSHLAGDLLYYGFTAGNGAATDGHIVTSAMPVPEPATWLMLALGGTGLLMRRRLAGG